MIEVGAAVKYLGQKWTVKETKKSFSGIVLCKIVNNSGSEKIVFEHMLEHDSTGSFFKKQKGITT